MNDVKRNISSQPSLTGNQDPRHRKRLQKARFLEWSQIDGFESNLAVSQVQVEYSSESDARPMKDGLRSTFVESRIAAARCGIRFPSLFGFF